MEMKDDGIHGVKTYRAHAHTARLELCVCRPELDAITEELFEHVLDDGGPSIPGHVSAVYKVVCPSCGNPVITVWPDTLTVERILTGWRWDEQRSAITSGEEAA
jgi:hypothetical protein